MASDAVIFRSPRENLEIVVRPGYIEKTADGRVFQVHDGKYVKFWNGVAPVPADDEEALKAVRKSQLYGVEIFEDTQTQAKVEVKAVANDEVAELRRQLEEMKALLAEQTKAKDEESALEKFRAAKAKAKELGIKGERDWKLEDYEEAIAKHGGAQ